MLTRSLVHAINGLLNFGFRSDGRIGVRTFWNGSAKHVSQVRILPYALISLFLGDVLNFPSNYEIKVLKVVEEHCSKYLLNSR